MKNDVYVGIGSNIVPEGYRDIHSALLDATTQLSNFVDVVAASPWYVTAPIPASDQPDFLNAVLQIQTNMTAHELLEYLQIIEANFGRVRTVKNAARKLDLDILAYGLFVIEDERLSVPHPRLSERAFVLLPWCDIAPDWRHPIQGITIRELAEQIRLTNQKIQKYSPLISP